jgi:hypothetical protein
MEGVLTILLFSSSLLFYCFWSFPLLLVVLVLKGSRWCASVLLVSLRLYPRVMSSVRVVAATITKKIASNID